MSDLLIAADLVAHAASLPTEERGSILPWRPQAQPGSLVNGWSVFEAQQRTIPVQALRWPRSRETYEDMVRDPQIQGLLTSVYLPLRHMEWYLDPNGAPASLVAEIAEDFGLPLPGEESPEDGPGIDFDDHLRLALHALAYGHKFFEESGVIEGNGPGAKYRLRRLAERPNETLQRIDISSAGDLLSVRVPSASPAVDGPFVDLPAEHLLPYVWDRRGADWSGRPLLYGLYRAWLLKDEALRNDATMLRRFSGIPTAEATMPGVSKEAHEEAARIAQTMRSGDESGVSMPYGTRLRIIGMEGTAPNAIERVRYHDEQMARAFMQMFAELGNTRNGSRALGTTLMDHYALGVLAVAKWVRKTTMILVRRVAVRNYGPDVVLPRIRCRQDDNEDMPIADLVAAIDAGLIVVDDDLEAQIRERANLVPRNPAEAGRTPPGSQPPVIAATARRTAPSRARATAEPPAQGTPSDRAGTDFADLQTVYEDAVSHLTSAWTGVQAAQIAELVVAVKAAASIADLAALQPASAGAAVLAATLSDVAAHGAQSVVAEAATQGVTVAEPDMAATTATLTDAAGATADLLARALGQSAASVATGLWTPEPDLDSIADQVRQHLEGLAGATPSYEIAGLVSRAQNDGRFAAYEQDDQPGDYYGSEVNDTNTCEPCRAEDDTEFPSLAEARRDYPAGGFIGCEGGKRCRGTVVKIWAETPGQTA